MVILVTELEKCMAGECYDCHDKIFLDFKARARKLLKEYHALAYEQKEEKTNILKQDNISAALTRSQSQSVTAAGWEEALLCFRESRSAAAP